MTLSSLTKAQLLGHIASLEALNLSQARELEAMRLRISIAERNATPLPRRLVPEHFAAARAMAIASGHSVRVTA